MGEGLKKMFEEIHSPSRAEDAEDIGEDSDSDDGDSHAPSPREHLFSPPFSKSPLYDFISLVEQLPIRKGLSQYYQGKSQSFTSLSDVKSLEDLQKKEKEIHYLSRKMKPCKSYAGLAQVQAQESASSSETCSTSIPKKVTLSMATSCASSMTRTGSEGFLSRGGGRPPPIRVHKYQ